METITQTNRTILFAEMNPERLNLVTLIGDVRGKNSLDDDNWWSPVLKSSWRNSRR